MSENNLPNMDENNVDTSDAIAENEIAEEVEVTEEAVEDAVVTENEPACDCGCDHCTEDQPQWLPDEPIVAKKSNIAAIVIGIVAALILIVAGLLVWYINKPLPVPTAIDVTGQTIQDVAENYGLEVSEYLYMLNLPENLPADTSIAQAEMYIPLRRAAVENRMSLQKYKEQAGIPDEVTGKRNILDKVLKLVGINRYKITGNTPYGVAMGEVPLDKFVGEENLEEFKAQFSLGDEVTTETKWKEVYEIIMTKQKADYEAQQNAMNAAMEQTDPAEGEEVDGEIVEDTQPAETETTAE